MTAPHVSHLQLRLIDMNLGGHVDNVAAIGLISEARTMFLGIGATEGSTGFGVLAQMPPDVVVLVGGIQVEYRREVHYRPNAQARVDQWISKIGRTSFTVGAHLYGPGSDRPDVVAESRAVLWDRAAGAAWPLSSEVRRSLEAHAGEPVAFR